MRGRKCLEVRVKGLGSRGAELWLWDLLLLEALLLMLQMTLHDAEFPKCKVPRVLHAVSINP